MRQWKQVSNKPDLPQNLTTDQKILDMIRNQHQDYNRIFGKQAALDVIEFSKKKKYAHKKKAENDWQRIQPLVYPVTKNLERFSEFEKKNTEDCKSPFFRK